MALVHVEDGRIAAQGAEDGEAGEAEDGLLTETVVGVAAVEVVGELTVPGVVAFDVGVEQEDGDDVAGDARTSKRQARTMMERPARVMVTIWPAEGRVVSGDQTTSVSVCWPTESRCCWK